MDVFKNQLNEFSQTVSDTPPVRGYTCANSNSSYASARTKKHLLHGVVIKDIFIKDQQKQN